MGAPIDRTAKAAMDLNLVNGETSDAPKLKASDNVLYDYVDGLNAAQDAHALASTLAHPDGSVKTAKIADGAVTTPKLADQSVTTSKIALGAVGAAQLATSGQVNESVNNVLITALKADVTQRAINAKYPPAPLVAAMGDNVTDDSDAIQNLLNYTTSNGLILFIPPATYKITKALVFSDNSRMCGTALSILQYTSTSGYAFELTGNRINIDILTIKGNTSINFMRMNTLGTSPGAVTDSLFNGLRVEGFNIAIVSSFSWDNLFINCRFHTCTKLATFGNQTNVLSFKNCRFSTYTTGFDFTNCGVISFEDCDIVGYVTTPATNVVNAHFQSTVYFRNCYVEHVTNFGVCGAFNDSGRAVLSIEGGLITGSQPNLSIAVQSKKGVVLDVKNVACDKVTIYKPASQFFVGLLKSSSIRHPYNAAKLLSKYDGDVDITTVYPKINAGGTVTTELRTGFARITTSAFNGIKISTTLTLGNIYTLVIGYKTSNGFYLVEPVEGTDLPTSTTITEVVVPFVSANASNTLRLSENAGLAGRIIDIAYIRFYEGLIARDFSYIVDSRVTE